MIPAKYIEKQYNNDLFVIFETGPIEKQKGFLGIRNSRKEDNLILSCKSNLFSGFSSNKIVWRQCFEGEKRDLAKPIADIMLIEKNNNWVKMRDRNKIMILDGKVKNIKLTIRTQLTKAFVRLDKVKNCLNPFELTFMQSLSA